ncbi:MAG: NAD(P)/FAD-dependent oxidoreductase [Calditrichaeota bacterium]|nr:NAD(P)/FAD-dependent oxidoreductase [Calditrichota bacterium]
MKEMYDIVVVGAGPAGSTAARVAARNGASVLMLEKDREVGIPVRCAEAVGEIGMNRIVKLRPEWIANRIEGVRIIAPDGTRINVQHDEIGFILDRKKFDYDLARMAAEQGVEILTKAYVFDLIKENGFVSGVKFRYLDEEYSVRAKIVIGADGVESRVGRWAGLKTHLSLQDIETCAQMTITNIPLEKNYCDFYFGSDIAPGGYLWVFPKNENTANVGLGISGVEAKDKPPIEYLKKFVKEHFPEGAVLTTVAGGVPCAPLMKKMVGDGIMLVGDAARQAFPITGGGIYSGMLAAKIAGEVAVEAIKSGDWSEKILSRYQKLWEKEGGTDHKRAYRLKDPLFKLTDDDLNKTAAAVVKKPKEKHTIVTIFKIALLKKPKLIAEVLKLFLR